MELITVVMDRMKLYAKVSNEYIAAFNELTYRRIYFFPFYLQITIQVHYLVSN